MHPDRRRAGRAIRKQRREATIRSPFSASDMARIAFVIRGAADALAEFGKAAAVVAARFASTPVSITLPRGLDTTPFSVAEVGAGDPSLTGVSRAREAHSASQEVSPK